MSWNTHIPKFRRFVLQNFPFIEEDFDALTDYALICKVIEYLNKVIDSQNGLISEVETFETNITNSFDRLEGLFNDLKSYVDNYFDDLNVQEEINNKLDAMVEDGTLQEIISTYIQSNVAWTFDTVSDMQSATNLVDGSYARTLGFSVVNDRGGALYLITDDQTPNGMDIISIGDGSLQAKLVIEDKLMPQMLGAFGEANVEVTAIMQRLFTLNAGYYFIPAGTYLVDGNLDIPSNTLVDCEVGAIIKRKPTSATHYYVMNMINKNNIELRNVYVLGDKSTHTGSTGEFGYCFNVAHSQNITLTNCTAEEAWGDGFYIGNNFESEKTQETNYILLDNCKALKCRRNGYALGCGDNITLRDCYAYKTQGTAPEAGLDLEPESPEGQPAAYLNNVQIINFTSEQNDELGINVYAAHKLIKNLVIDGHNAYSEKVGVRVTINSDVTQPTNVIYRNAYIRNTGQDAIYVARVTAPGKLYIQNVICDGKSGTNGYACVQLYGQSSGQSLEGITIDNVSYQNTNSAANFSYLINQQHHFDGNLPKVTVKNLIKRESDPKVCFYDYSADVIFENCDIRNDSTHMSGTGLGVYDLYTSYTNTGLSGNTLVAVSATIPDTTYELLFTNNGAARSGVNFNVAYTTYYNGVVVNNTIDSYNPTSYIKFRKIGSNIFVLTTDMTTATP